MPSFSSCSRVSSPSQPSFQKHLQESSIPSATGLVAPLRYTYQTPPPKGSAKYPTTTSRGGEKSFRQQPKSWRAATATIAFVAKCKSRAEDQTQSGTPNLPELRFPQGTSVPPPFGLARHPYSFGKKTAPPGACQNGTDTCRIGPKCNISSDDGPELAQTSAHVRTISPG